MSEYSPPLLDIYHHENGKYENIFHFSLRVFELRIDLRRYIEFIEIKCHLEIAILHPNFKEFAIVLKPFLGFRR